MLSQVAVSDVFQWMKQQFRSKRCSPDTAKVSVRLQFGRTPAGTRLSMAASCFGVQWAAEQNAERCEGTASRWQTAAKTVLLIKWDGWSRATATTVAELDDARNDVRILKQSGRT